MDYRFTTQDDRNKVLAERLRNIELQHYDTDLSLRQAHVVGADSNTIQQLILLIESLEKGHAFFSEELGK